MSEEEPKKSKRGFAAMSYDKRAAIASKGGTAAQKNGKCHKFTVEEARAAGRKGGRAHTSEHMKEIGRIGGKARAAKQKAANEQL